MNNIIKKFFFLIKKPSVIIIVGKGRVCAKEAISKVLKSDALIFDSDLSKPKEIEKFSFLLRKSRLPILVVTHFGEIPPDKIFFAAGKEETLKIRKLAKVLPSYGFLILNFDDETLREIKNETKAHFLTYGFQERADFRVSDVNSNPEGTNFKINYQGNIIPFWLKDSFSKEKIYSVLAAVCVGAVKEINLVEISQILRN